MNRIEIPIAVNDRTAPVKSGDTRTTGDAGFGHALERAVDSVSRTQAEADASVEALATGRENNIHTTMIAVEKADLSFQLLIQVRNKIITAYETIMRMQV